MVLVERKDLPLVEYVAAGEQSSLRARSTTPASSFAKRIKTNSGTAKKKDGAEKEKDEGDAAPEKKEGRSYSVAKIR